MIALEHPEEALERAITGTLSPAEQRPLEEHLAICAACQAHLALASFALESFGEAEADSAADRSNVERAMSALAEPVRPRVSRLPKRVIWLAAAALLAMGGFAAAAWLGPTPRLHDSSTMAPAMNAVTSQPMLSKAADPPKPNEEAPPVVAPEVTSSQVSAPSSAAAESVTASGLFRKASALRAAGDSDAAIAVFQKLQALFPRSRESTLSLMVAGRLLLDRGRPAQALKEFDRYLSEGGAASEHALAGRAAALQGLGRTADEASAWQRLLTSYPGSVYDQRAKARLARLLPLTAGPISAP